MDQSSLSGTGLPLTAYYPRRSVPVPLAHQALARDALAALEAMEGLNVLASTGLPPTYPWPDSIRTAAARMNGGTLAFRERPGTGDSMASSTSKVTHQSGQTTAEDLDDAANDAGVEDNEASEEDLEDDAANEEDVEDEPAQKPRKRNPVQSPYHLTRKGPLLNQHPDKSARDIVQHHRKDLVGGMILAVQAELQATRTGKGNGTHILKIAQELHGQDVGITERQLAKSLSLARKAEEDDEKMQKASDRPDGCARCTARRMLCSLREHNGTRPCQQCLDGGHPCT